MKHTTQRRLRLLNWLYSKNNEYSIETSQNKINSFILLYEALCMANNKHHDISDLLIINPTPLFSNIDYTIRLSKYDDSVQMEELFLDSSWILINLLTEEDLLYIVNSIFDINELEFKSTSLKFIKNIEKIKFKQYQDNVLILDINNHIFLLNEVALSDSYFNLEQLLKKLSSENKAEKTCKISISNNIINFA
ncbi:MAG: hypothetical protein N4A40_13065 [Tissierellales bacterium]|jgi:hypothetical protein|nr:hypothetical protein [Tissierellales bacterium]